MAISSLNVTANVGPQTELLMATEVLHVDNVVDEGKRVSCLAVPWLSMYEHLERNPGLFFEFSNEPEAFERFIAGAYSRAGYEVTLTPRSGDGGKDIIAERRGFGAVRILDQCKAFSEGRKVDHNDVRAMLGVIGADSNTSKGVITTTSTFAPGVLTDTQIQQYVPFRLELRDGVQLQEWLKTL